MIYHRHEPDERSSDLLAASLLLAAAAHAVVILGVTFSVPDPDKASRGLPTLDITMVPDKSTPPPENPDYLANTNRDGTGDPAQQAPQPELLASRLPEPAANEPKPTPVLTTKESNSKEQHSPQQIPNVEPTLSAAELIERSLEMIGLDDQIEQWAKSDSNEPKHTFISARTREHKYANYMAAWVAKVERVGNLNYPNRARRKDVSGTLLLDVALNSDGSILTIKLLRSSGTEVLDDAAVRIVKLAAPFAPFPPEIRKETDVLHITRTWEFLKTHRLRGG
ncbi:MAG: energy transducer TonB [Gammaproteobacteria bacterium]